MRRRSFIAGLGAAAAWPLAARGQQPERTQRIGMLTGLSESDPHGQALVQSLLHGLADLGWSAGHNVHLDYRFAAGDPIRAQTFAAELVGLGPDLIVANPIDNALRVQRLTVSIPIVFLIGVDPVGRDYVGSLARPGSNVTGFSSYEPATSGKWLATLKEVAPSLTRVIVLSSVDTGLLPFLRSSLETAANALSLNLVLSELHGAAEIGRAIDAFSSTPNGGVVVLPSPFLSAHRASIIALAAEHRLPAVYPFRFYVDDGGLMCYSVDEAEIYYRSASYVDRILRGTKPAELPVQQPTKYQLTINLKTAKALGLTIPPTLLATADEVIE